MADIDVYDIKGRIVESVTELFDTMLDMEISLADDGTEPSEVDGSLIAGMLSFTGDVVGNFRVQVSEVFARIMTAEMLGMETDEIEGEDEIKDVILEACNIVGGNLKSGFNDGGLSCIISAPSIAMGSSFDIDTLNMARYEKHVFLHQKHVFLVEVCVKAGEDAPSEAVQRLTPIDVNKFKKLDIISTAGDTLIEMFDKMFEMKLEASDSTSEASLEGLQIMGTVDFTGEVTGSTQILAGETLARIITSKMSDRPLEEIKDEDEIKDVVGEMCNVVGGNLKTGFCDSGLTCEISPPSIILGNDFKVENLNMARYEHFIFRFYEHDIFIQICAKIDESAQVRDQVEEDAGSAEEEVFEAGEPLETVDDMTNGQTSEIGDKAESADDVPDRDVTSSNIDLILDIPIEVSVELGRTRMKIQEVSMLEAGTSIILSNSEGEPLDILANGRLIARGEVVVENGRYGIRITEVVNRMERIKSLG
ncbi:MAG: flagellar motor switch protein FliN [Deltaproteobacteria bacterium]|nr:flagellar motor switch protein FliN [Deltaproteobacteria bacterium]